MRASRSAALAGGVIAAGALVWLLLASRSGDAAGTKEGAGPSGPAAPDAGPAPIPAPAPEGAPASIATSPYQDPSAVAADAAGTWVITGRVIDELEQPLAGVKVVGRRAPGYDARIESATRLEAVSAEGGGFRIAQKPPAEATSFRVNLASERFEGTSKEFTVQEGDPPPAPFTIKAVAFKAKIAGTVKDEDGKPIAGAKVGWGREVTTDAQGAYVYPVTLSYPTTYLRAKAKGYAAPHHAIQLPKAGETMTFDMVLEAEGILEGIVRREDGTPLAGATAWTWNADRESTTTASDGRFRLAGYESGREHNSLYVEAPGFVKAVVPVTFQGRTSKVEVVMKPGVPLQGQVVGPDGKPVVGAKVTCGEKFSGVAVDRFSGKDGRFSFDAVPVAEVELSAEREDLGEARQMVKIAAAGPNDVTLAIKAGHTVSGRIVDETNAPIKEISIAGRHKRNYLEVRAKTDAEGRFSIARLPAEDVSLEVYGRGYLRSQTPVKVDRDDIVIVMKKNGKMAGTVIDARTRAPVTRFRVRIVPAELRKDDQQGGGYSSTWGQEGHAIEAADGVWRMDDEDLQPGGVFGIEVRAEGHGPVTHPRVVVATDPDPAAEVFALEPAATIQGFVVSSRNEPVAGATLTCMTAARLKRFSEQRSELFKDATTDAKGAFNLASAPAGEVCILVKSPEAPPFQAGPFTVGVGQEVTGLRIEIPAGATVSGVVLDPAGKPESTGHVEANCMERNAFDPMRRATLDAEGRFQLKSLAPGRHLISWYAERTWWPSLSREVVVASGGDVEVRLSCEGACSLRLVIEHESPLKQALRVRLAPVGSGNGADASVQPIHRQLQITEDVTEIKGLDAGLYLVEAIVSSKDFSHLVGSGEKITLAPGTIPEVRFKQK